MTNTNKFRGKILDGPRKGEWVIGHYFMRPTTEETIENIIRQYSEDFIGYTDYVVDPTTVGQYIGIKDKNGTEIFSGMFCRSRFEEGVIAMSHNGQWCIKNGSACLPLWTLIDNRWEFEVMETDNPDLLTQQGE